MEGSTERIMLSIQQNEKTELSSVKKGLLNPV